jgi:hypothetical protein
MSRTGSYALAVCGALAAGAAGTWILLSAGCSSSSSGGDSVGGLTTDQACSDNSRAMCAKLQECSPAAVTTAYGDLPTCMARLKAACLDTEGAPSTGANPEKAEACAQAFATYPCVDYRNKTNIPAPCQPVMGGLAAGSACEYPAQCQTGFCAVPMGSRCGVCAAEPSQGASCANLTNCSPDLQCTTDTLECEGNAGSGEACGMGKPCGAGFSCVADAGTGTPGTCQAAGAAVGTPCDGTNKKGPACDGALSLYCNGVTRTCALTQYADAGSPCGYDVEAGTNVQCTVGTCQGAVPNRGTPGQCAGREADEGPCAVPDGGASVSSAGCLPPARCIAATGKCEFVTASSCR